MEKRWRKRAIIFALIASLLMSIPTLTGYWASQKPERVFLGYPFVDDFNQYASFIRQTSQEGNFLYENRYTTEEQEGRFLCLYFSFLGIFVKVSGFPIRIAWALAAFGVGVAFLLCSWALARAIFKDEEKAFWAYGLLCFSSGLGWATRLLSKLWTLPFLQASQMNDDIARHFLFSTFGSLYNPLWYSAYLALVLMILFLLKAEERGKKSFILYAAVLLSLIWAIHSYTACVASTLIAFLVVMPLLLEWNWHRFMARLRLVALLALFLLPVAMYFLWAKQDRVFSMAAASSLWWNPHMALKYYPIGYGLLLPLGLIGIYSLYKGGGPGGDALFSWLLAGMLWSHIPWLAGWKFQYTLHLPLAFLSGEGLFYLMKPIKKKRWVFFSLALLFCSLSSGIMLYTFSQSVARRDALYLSQGEIEAMEFLNTLPKGHVLAQYRQANAIPSLSHQKVFMGHWFLTIAFQDKEKEALYFFSPFSSAHWRANFLISRGIDYLFISKNQKASLLHGLPVRKRYENSSVEIYEVERAS